MQYIIGNSEKKEQSQKTWHYTTQSESLDNRPRYYDKTKQENCQSWCEHLKLNAKRIFQFSKKYTYR